MNLTPFADPDPTFRTSEVAHAPLRAACDRHPDVATAVTLGESEEGRPIDGFVLGTGETVVSLIAGNHADEPVGPETLRTLVLGLLQRREEARALLETVTFVIVPHTNPDGEARNRPWIEAWPDLRAYARYVERELPGRDLEFGFPDMRPENRHVAAFLREHAPIDLHASLHGMAASEGAMLLINRPWAFRTETLQNGYREAAAEAGLRMHDHNRKGEKGFFWIDKGFQTTPRGEAMRTYFKAQGDPEMAARFHDSSMEMVMGWGGDPLCLVTELPLWVVRDDDPTPGTPETYLALKKRLPEVKMRLEKGEPVDDLLAPFDVEPLPVATAMHLQLTALTLALETVTRG